jgi:hypothetical protein
MTEQVAKKGRWQIWLMIAMLSGVIVAGFLIFPSTEEQRNNLLSRLGTTNQGEFVLPPTAMVDLALTDGNNNPWLLANQKAKWRMIIAGAGDCVDQCREMLYLTRQVHISLGKYSRRFERLYLVQGENLGEETAEYIKLNHPFLKVLHGNKVGLKELLENTNAPFTEDLSSSADANVMRAYLVDQQGFIMMSYTLAHEGREMIEDIQHLMKYSSQ